MPIGGSAYYDKFKKKAGPTASPAAAPARVQAPIPVPARPVVQVQAPSEALLPTTALKKSKNLVKTIRPSGRTERPAVRTRVARSTGSAAVTDSSALDEVISQILDLTQRVHSVAGQAEAAVLRAEAAVLKAELAVGKAEAAGLRAETSSAKCENAVSLTEAAVFKSQSSAKLADMFAGKAGLAAGKFEVSAAGGDVTNTNSEAAIVTPVVQKVSAGSATDTDVDNRTKKIDSPVSQIAVMSMKLRSGMRQIEEANEQFVDRSGSFGPSPTFNVPVGRDNLASGLISLDSDTALPRVAPFIMDDVSFDPRSRDEVNSGETDVDSLSKSSRNGVGSAA